MKKGGFRIKSRIWISSDRGTFLGEGRIRLLQEIEASGSISMAASNMGMSYKKAWSLVRSMNEYAAEPLVIKSIGGKNGGGSKLSEFGKDMIRIFNEIDDGCKDFLDKKFESYNVLSGNGSQV